MSDRSSQDRGGAVTWLRGRYLARIRWESRRNLQILEAAPCPPREYGDRELVQEPAGEHFIKGLDITQAPPNYPARRLTKSLMAQECSDDCLNPFAKLIKANTDDYLGPWLIGCLVDML
jgi:hypothetical protein